MNERSTSRKRKARRALQQYELLQELHQSAIHEAGHAVIEDLVFQGVEYVSIEPEIVSYVMDGKLYDIDSAGCTQPRSEGWTLKTRKDFERECVSMCAGAIAEEKLFGTVPPDAEASDIQYVNWYAKVLGVADAERDKIFKIACNRVAKLFNDDRVWGAVVEVAQRLLAKKRLEGDEVHEIVEASGARTRGRRHGAVTQNAARKLDKDMIDEHVRSLPENLKPIADEVLNAYRARLPVIIKAMDETVLHGVETLQAITESGRGRAVLVIPGIDRQQFESTDLLEICEAAREVWLRDEFPKVT